MHRYLSLNFLPKKFLTSSAYPWIIWSLGAAFFFAEYFAHVSLGAMTSQVMRDFKVGAMSLGNMSAFFWYAYLGMQIPVGALVDRYGPHKLMMLTAALCGLTCFLFGMAHTLWLAELSRFFMGITASFAFIGTLKLVTLWFPSSQLGFLAGMTQAVGMLGAIVGEGPVAYGVATIGWRATMGVMGFALVGLALLIGILVKEHPNEINRSSHQVASAKALWLGFKEVLRNKQSWLNGIFVGLLFAPTQSFAEFWGPSYIHTVYGISPALAATLTSIIFVGWGIGGPLVGKLSDRLQSRRQLLWTSALASLITLSIILYMPSMPHALLIIMLFLYGIANTGVGISYALSGEINRKPIAGLSMAFANMSSVIIGAALQPVIGWLLELQWDHALLNQSPVYSVTAYKIAMLVLPLCLLISVFIAFTIKETHCRPVDEQ